MEKLLQQSSVSNFTKKFAISEKKQQKKQGEDDGAVNIEFTEVSDG